jgi:hypothetical protein
MATLHRYAENNLASAMELLFTEIAAGRGNAAQECYKQLGLVILATARDKNSCWCADMILKIK